MTFNIWLLLSVLLLLLVFPPFLNSLPMDQITCHKFKKPA